MKTHLILQALTVVLLASALQAGRIKTRHRKRGVLNHARFSAYSFGHHAPPVPLSYVLRHGGASVASYAASYPRYRKVVLQTPAVAVGQKPVHYDEGYVVRPVQAAPVLVQRPAVYPAVVQSPGVYYPGLGLYPSVDLHPSTVVAGVPAHYPATGVPGHYPATSVQVNPGHHLVPIAPRPVVETPVQPQYPGVFAPAQVPSAVHPEHYYPANSFAPGNPLIPSVPVLPPTGRPFYTIPRPGVFPVGPGVFSVNDGNANDGGGSGVSGQPRPSDNQPGQQPDFQPQYPMEDSYPTVVHHHNQQPDTGYHYGPTSSGSSGVYLTPASAPGHSASAGNGGGQGSTSQQSPWTPMHPVEDPTGGTEYHHHHQVTQSSSPAISLLPPYHARYHQSQHDQHQHQQAYHQQEYADY